MSTKRVLITGANKGIGRATVVAVLEADPETVVLLGSRSSQRGNEARAEILNDHPEWENRLTVLQIDVSSDASVAAAAEQVAAKFSEATPLYGVVNNAGIGGTPDLVTTLEVNTRGPHRVCHAFIPLLDPERGRIVNVSSASGPMFVAGCSEQRQRQLTSPEITWPEIEAIMDEAIALDASGGDFEAAGLGAGQAYGLSKACLNALTIALAREYPNLTINACTPGYIETDMTRPHAEAQGITPAEAGMKPPAAGTRASLRLLLGNPGGSGMYFGSDAERSPLDRYRSPGDPPYTGA